MAETVIGFVPETSPETILDQVCPDNVAGEELTVTLTTVPESVADQVRNTDAPTTFWPFVWETMVTTGGTVSVTTGDVANVPAVTIAELPARSVAESENEYVEPGLSPVSEAPRLDDDPLKETVPVWELFDVPEYESDAEAKFASVMEIPVNVAEPVPVETDPVEAKTGGTVSLTMLPVMPDAVAVDHENTEPLKE